MHDGEVLCRGVHVFDSHILVFDKNSRLCIIQYCPFLVSCASYLDKYIFIFVYFMVIKCRKKYAILMSQAAMYSNIFEVQIL